MVTFLPNIAEHVYKNGFKAELIGRTTTAIHAYTSPGITWSVIARMPGKTWNKHLTLLPLLFLNWSDNSGLAIHYLTSPVCMNTLGLYIYSFIEDWNFKKKARKKGYDFLLEPRYDKTNKVSVRPAKTQISLGIFPDWSESSLCAQWVEKDPSFLHADSEDSDQTGRMPRLIWVFAGRTAILLVLSCRGSLILHKL